MKKVKYILIPVLVTLVVLLVSLYPSANISRKATAAPRAAVVTKYLLIPAAAFTITNDGRDYFNYGDALGISSGVGDFVAPVYLPPGARIRMIKLFAYDTNTGTNLCAALHESYPKVGGYKDIKHVCTTGSKGFQQPIGYLSHYVKWYYSYYILLGFPGSANLATTAVILKYTINL
jgi:hypothetical protein